MLPSLAGVGFRLRARFDDHSHAHTEVPNREREGDPAERRGHPFASFVCVLAADDDSGAGVGDSEALTHGPGVASGQDPGEGEDLHRLLRVRDQI